MVIPLNKRYFDAIRKEISWLRLKGVRVERKIVGERGREENWIKNIDFPTSRGMNLP